MRARLAPLVLLLTCACGAGRWYQVSTLELPARKEWPVEFGPHSPTCAELRWRLGARPGPAVVLVHGIHGVGREWDPFLEALSQRSFSALFEFKWSGAERLDDLMSRLSDGVTRLLQCAPEDGQRVLVVAHSAGGVIASYAVGRFSIPASTPHARVQVVTVASPLGGLSSRDPSPNGRAPFFTELGSALGDYPAPALGVEVLHLQTSAPGDALMGRTLDGHDPAGGADSFPRARTVTLPKGTTHDGALKVVAEHLGAGDFDAWVAAP